MQRTEWFSGSVKPVRAGVYERMYPAGKSGVVRYSYWSGEHWYTSGGTPSIATGALYYDDVAPRQALPWRGLVKP